MYDALSLRDYRALAALLGQTYAAHHAGQAAAYDNCIESHC